MMISTPIEISGDHKRERARVRVTTR